MEERDCGEIDAKVRPGTRESNTQTKKTSVSSGHYYNKNQK